MGRPYASRASDAGCHREQRSPVPQPAADGAGDGQRGAPPHRDHRLSAPSRAAEEYAHCFQCGATRDPASRRPPPVTASLLQPGAQCLPRHGAGGRASGASGMVRGFPGPRVANRFRRSRRRHRSRESGKDLRSWLHDPGRKPRPWPGRLEKSRGAARWHDPGAKRPGRGEHVQPDFSNSGSSMMNQVLVVDDEAAMRAALEANLSRRGWKVLTASGTTEAIERFRTMPCPLVITDMRMPDGDGLRVMQGVRALAPETAVIFLTAYGNVPEAVHAMQEGACDYLVKPISFEQLQQAAERVLTRRLLNET